MVPIDSNLPHLSMSSLHRIERRIAPCGAAAGSSVVPLTNATTLLDNLKGKWAPPGEFVMANEVVLFRCSGEKRGESLPLLVLELFDVPVFPAFKRPCWIPLAPNTELKGPTDAWLGLANSKFLKWKMSIGDTILDKIKDGVCLSDQDQNGQDLAVRFRLPGALILFQPSIDVLG